MNRLSDLIENINVQRISLPVSSRKLNQSHDNSLKLYNCDSWPGSDQTLFSLFQITLLLAFTVPANFKVANISNRIFLVIAYGLGVIWTFFRTSKHSASPWEWSPFIWYLILLGVNFIQAANITVQILLNKFPKDLVDLYTNLFQPIGVTIREFRDLARFGQIKHLNENSRYSIECSTKINQQISILLSGRLQVTFGSSVIHDIEPNEFVDSVEYKYNAFYCSQVNSRGQRSDKSDQKTTNFIVSEPSTHCYSIPSDESLSQVTITALEESKIISWDLANFIDYLENHDKMRNVIDALIGKDIIHKLYG